MSYIREGDMDQTTCKGRLGRSSHHLFMEKTRKEKMQKMVVGNEEIFPVT
jgi:hypothetical protein